MIHQDLQLKKVKKHNVHQLLLRHVAQRRTFCRILYETYLPGDKWKYIVTIGEAWVYLRDCNEKEFCFLSKTKRKKLYKPDSANPKNVSLKVL